MTLDELKTKILSDDLEKFVDTVLLARPAPYFSEAQVSDVAKALSTKYGLPVDVSQIHVVGSAKLGYALFSKRKKDGAVLPAFRTIRPDSDVDLAVICPEIFDEIWFELSRHAIRQQYMPWNSNRLGDYLVYGWIRPDHFPPRARLRRCDDWWDVFSSLSANGALGRKTISGGIYYSLEHLKMYQLRGLNQCRALLEINR